MLTPEELASKIYMAEANSTAYEGATIVEIHCSRRRQHTTPEEKELLKANGYVEMFNQLVVGWDMWCKPEQFPGRSFPTDI